MKILEGNDARAMHELLFLEGNDARAMHEPKILEGNDARAMRQFDPLKRWMHEKLQSSKETMHE